MKGNKLKISGMFLRDCIRKFNYITQNHLEAHKYVQMEHLQNVADGYFENFRRDELDLKTTETQTFADYIDTFGFRGGEFGNWMNQNDRQASLNMGFEALKDLAAALQISDQDIAFGGTLAIAFGARGSSNAAVARRETYSRRVDTRTQASSPIAKGNNQ